ncbi:MAG: carboxypeptidase regulatory-like domain-containing protein [Euryarchaeota archaeon]|nr:carboxypeptidase regulatory-like domain-containing protein [Euryarchaeota archaeon]
MTRARNGGVPPTGKGFVIALAMALLVSSCIGMRAEAANPPNAWVEGYVQMAGNLTGIDNATVIIQDTVDGSSQNATKTDATGYYRLGIYTPFNRNFRLTAFHQDYYYNATTVTLDVWLNLTNVNITLQATGGNNAQVWGYVYDAITLVPMMGVGVLGLSSDYMNSAQTDISGMYSMGLVAGREYTVHIADYVLPNLTYEGQNKVRRFNMFDNIRMDFFLEPMNASLTGTAKDEGGTPITTAEVHVYRYVERPTDGRTIEYTHAVNASGEYLFNLTRGIWQVEAYDTLGNHLRQSLTVMTYCNRTTTQDFRLDSLPVMATVFGNATWYENGSAAAGVSVNVGLVNSTWNGGTTTDGTGFYSIQVVPGSLRMEASTAGYMSNFESFSMGPGEILSIDLTLAPSANSAWIVGYVKFNGTPIQDVSISANFGRYTWANKTDAAGFYNISVPIAPLDMKASKAGYDTMNGRLDTYFALAYRQDFNLTAVQIAEEIRGIVEDDLGSPVEGATVWLDGAGGWSSAVGSDSSGFFQRSVAKGNATYVIYATGHEYVTGSIEILPDETYWLNATLNRAFATGRVYGHLDNIYTGAPIPHAKVTLNMRDMPLWKDLETDENGDFDTRIPPGVVVMGFDAWGNGFVDPGQAQFIVKPAPDKWLNLSFFPRDATAHVSGTIYNTTNASTVPGANVTMRKTDTASTVVADGAGNYSLNTSGGSFDLSARAPGFRINRTLTNQFVADYQSKVLDINLAVAPAWFSGNTSDNATDLDNDTLYDTLDVFVGVDVSVSDTYRIVGELSEGRSLSSTITRSEQNLPLGPGPHNVTVPFGGAALWSSKLDGYYVKLTLTTAANTSDIIDLTEHFTARHGWQEFDPPGARITGPSGQWLVDTDFDGLYNLLVVNATLLVNAPGNYSTSSGLMDVSGSQVDQTLGWDYYPVGSHGIQAAFEGTAIYADGTDLGSCQMYLINGLPADGNAPVQVFQTYTPYEFGIFQHYPIGATVKGRALNATGVPIQGLDVKLYNVTNRFMNSTKTNVSGWYELGGWAGDWLVAFDDFETKPSVYNGELANVSLAAGETKFVNRTVNFTGLDRSEISVTFPVASDWNYTTVDSLIYADADNRTIRFTFDILYWWAGNGDGYLSQDEVKKISAVVPWPNLPTNSSEFFTVDGFRYDLDSANVTRSLVAAGPVTSLDPVAIDIIGNYTANGTIPTAPNHGMLLNATYDNTPSKMDSDSNNVSYVYYVQSPGYWANTANASTANVTITGNNTDLATVDPLTDPVTNDTNTSEWIVLNFTQRGTASNFGSVWGFLTLQGSADRSGVTVTAYDNASGSAVASATTNGDGYYIINALAPGGYNISATKVGYVPGMAVNVGITMGASVQQDFSLMAVPPTISHTNVNGALVNWSYEIYVDAHDESGVNTVLLNYTGVDLVPVSVPMTKIASTPTYFATIPAQAATGIVTYTIWASNVRGASSKSPSIGNYATEIYDTKVGAIAPYWRTTSSIALSDSSDFSARDANNVTLWYDYSSDNVTWGNWTEGAWDSYPWDGVTWSFGFPDGEGYYEFCSIARDNKSCVEEAPPVVDAECAYDGTEPTSSIDAITPFWNTASPIPIAATASDGLLLANVSAWYRYAADNATWGAWTAIGTDTVVPWTWNFVPAAAGYYQFHSRANDTAGNYEATNSSWDAWCAYDNVAPTSVIDAIVPYWRTTSPITITATANDNLASNVYNVSAWYRYAVDNATWGAWTAIGTDTASPWSWSFAPAANGYYQFYSRANDTAGNYEATNSSWDAWCAYDSVGPTSSVDVTGAYWQTASPFTINASATDTVSGVTGVEFWYRFSAGNVTWGGWSMFGNDTAAPWSWQFAPANGSGYYEFYTQASDTAGYYEAAPTGADAGHGYDIDAPAITSHSASPSPCELGRSINVSASLSDLSGVGGAWFNVSLNGAFLANQSMNVSGAACWLIFMPGATGTLNFTIWANDTLGHWNSSSVSIVVQDTTAPSITGLYANPSSQEVLGAVNVSATISDLSGVATYRINITSPGAWLLNDTMKKGAGANAYYYNFTCDLLGDYSFVVWAVDAKGNGNATSGTARSQDTQLPSADAGMAQTVESGTTVTLDASLSADNFGIENFTWSFNDNGIRRLYGKFANYTFSVNGTFEITLTLRDFGGNTAAARTWVNVSVATNTGTVTGTILDANGNAVAGAAVYVDGTSPTIETTTDSLGRFTLTGVPTGSRTIVVVANGYRRFTQDVQVLRAQTAAMGSLTIEKEAGGGAPAWLWMAIIAAIVAVAVIVAIVLIAARKRRSKSAKTVIDEIFLMYNDGRLIKHFTRRLRPDMDSDILSSMLVAVQDFIKDSFKGEEGMLDEMKFGRFQILLGRGKYIIVCAIVLGEELDILRPQVQKCVRDIEEKYKAALETWDGEMGKLTGTFKYVMDLIDGRYA